MGSHGRIKVITGYDGHCCFSELTVANMREYCNRWGYDFVAKLDKWEPLDRNPVWRKVEMLVAELADSDWAVWFDIDVFVLNMTISLESLIDERADLVVTEPFEPCLGCKRPVYNTGILLFRNCGWSREILDRWWMAKYVQDRAVESAGGCTWPREVLDRWWTSEGLEDDRPESGGCPWLGEMGFLSCRVCHDPREASHIKVLPMKIAGWARLTGSPEQVLTHQYGAPNTQKEQVLRSFLPLVIR